MSKRVEIRELSQRVEDDLERWGVRPSETTEHSISNCEERIGEAILACIKVGYTAVDVYYAAIGCALEVISEKGRSFADEAFNECFNERFLTQEDIDRIALTLSASDLNPQ